MLGRSSKWVKVKSGVPQGSVLGPLLFLIYINDIDECVVSRVLKFADDTKLIGVVANDEDVKTLQNDLRNLCGWSEDWLMLFNVEKCKVMHMGHNNRRNIYEMEGRKLEEVKEERDLGIIVQEDLKWGKQCLKAVKTANKVLGMIKRTFCFLSKEIVITLYKSLVRPHLEYSVQAWRPHLKKILMLLKGYKEGQQNWLVH
jgi:ribonuclease P/MRP protein subunit RPP40